MTHFQRVLGAGVLASMLMSSTAALAQSLDLSAPPPAAGPPAQAPAFYPAQQQLPPGMTPYVLRMNDLDETGLPRPMTIQDAITAYGPQGAALLVQDDRNRCIAIRTLREAEAELRRREQALREAEIRLANAQTDSERRIAQAQVNQRRRGLIDFLLGLAQIGLGVATADGNRAYAGLVAVGVVKDHVRGQGQNEGMEIFLEQMGLHSARVGLYDQRLELVEQRLQISSAQGEFWYSMMESYCNNFHQAAGSNFLTYSASPIAGNANNAPPAYRGYPF